MQIKRSVRLTLRSDNDAQDTKKFRPVKIRVSYGGYRIELSTGLAVAADDWDAAAGKMKDGRTAARGVTASDANACITEYLTAISDAFKEAEVRKRIPKPEDLKNGILEKVLGKLPPEEDAAPRNRTLRQAYEEFTKINAPAMAWSVNTRKKFVTMWNNLSAFRPGLNFDGLDEGGLIRYLDWLRYEKPIKTGRLAAKDDDSDTDGSVRHGLGDETAKKEIDNLRRFLKWADSRGYPVHPDYRIFHPRYRRVQNPVVFLTDEEIKKIWNLPLPDDGHAITYVRDVLVFCCYTGLRYSDAAALRRSDLQDGYFIVTTKKTADSLYIEYNKVSSAILKKYADRDLPGGAALPVISNQKMNVLVKEVCRRAGIDAEVLHTSFKGGERTDVRRPKWQAVGTHTGRRSFICNGLAKGVPPHVMMKWTGHSSYEAMRPYIDAVDTVRAREMSRFDDIDLEL